ncbi:glycerophosphodiester phosphodiesterase [Rhodoferax sp.]|uniref:glycerophosphodiester phosphodiesterase n=1 Tax=Rhodoferax sp. TaxID=50421 RepID=UPI00274AD5C7|nr:glycerophosphodiester phosphodiesterase [Rhodoferax sp.]
MNSVKQLWVGGLLATCLCLVTPHGQAFDLQAHRGGRGLLPENTLAAFENAIRLGVTTLELDIAITADGVAVISHDPALNPAITRDADGQWLTQTGPLIKFLTLAQLQRYQLGRLDTASPYGRQFASQAMRDGQRIPTLTSLFELVKDLGADQVEFDIETKVFPTRPADTVAPEVFVQVLLATIREAGMTQRVMVQSFDWRTLQLIQRIAPGLRTVYLTVQGRGFNNLADGRWTAGLLLRNHASVAHLVKAAGGMTWAPHFNDLTLADLKQAQQLGLKVLPWTVNEPPDMDRLIGWGVDGLISDYPDRLRDRMKAQGLALPKAWNP